MFVTPTLVKMMWLLSLRVICQSASLKASTAFLSEIAGNRGVTQLPLPVTRLFWSLW